MQNLPISSPLKDITTDQWIQYGATKKLESNIDGISNLTKALSAGYGGGGAPTAMTGGSVLQSESLDDGRNTKSTAIKAKGFQYVSCQSCGKEGIYYPNQSKCRDCSKPFSFEQLIKLITRA